MLDVHAIADDQLARPILSWSVFAVASGERLGRISVVGGEVRAEGGAARVRGGRYRLETAMGEVSLHDGLADARDAAACLFSPPPRESLN